MKNSSNEKEMKEKKTAPKKNTQTKEKKETIKKEPINKNHKSKKEEPKKKETKKEVLWPYIIIIILLLVIIAIICYKKYFKGTWNTYYEIEERTDKVLSTDLNGNKAVAWLKVQGTNIDTPIVATPQNLEGEIDANYLWTSSNYVEGENRKVIYGHNIRNVSSYPDIANPDHFRFEQLVSFAYYDFAKENLYIQYNDGKEDAIYKIYAVSFNNTSDEYGQSYEDSLIEEYISKAKENSIYDYSTDVKKTDELLSLVTCTRYFGAFEKTQFRVDARKLRKNEKIVQYKVETNSNYDIIK